jgi:hypothetical protein
MVDPATWQGFPAPMHWPTRQQPPALHDDPSQHGSPGPPQRLQTPFWQSVPDAQVGAVGQQSSAGPPQGTQMEDAVPQVVLGAEQSPPAQQGKVRPPQLPQAPLLHVPPPAIGQVAPAAVHTPPTQQPPWAQPFPAQHASPARPQGPASTVAPSLEVGPSVVVLPPVPVAAPPPAAPAASPPGPPVPVRTACRPPHPSVAPAPATKRSSPADNQNPPRPFRTTSLLPAADCWTSSVPGPRSATDAPGGVW